VGYKFWSEQYGKEISIEETKEINRNLTGFFEILMKWDSEKSEKESVEE